MGHWEVSHTVVIIHSPWKPMERSAWSSFHYCICCDCKRHNSDTMKTSRTWVLCLCWQLDNTQDQKVSAPPSFTPSSSMNAWSWHSAQASFWLKALFAFLLQFFNENKSDTHLCISTSVSCLICPGEPVSSMGFLYNALAFPMSHHLLAFVSLCVCICVCVCVFACLNLYLCV